MFTFSMINGGDFYRKLLRFMPLCVALCRSLFLLHCGSTSILSLSLFLCFIPSSSPSLSFPRSFSLSTFPLSALHVDFSLDSRQHALLFFIPRRNPRLFPFIPVFSAHLDTAHRLIMDLLTVLQRFRRGSFYSCDRYYYVAATTSAKPVSILALR